MKQSPEQQERSRFVARTIERAMVSALHAEPRAAIDLLNAARSSLMPEASSEAEKVEIARRVAEAKISTLWDREDATTEFQASWIEIERLGYSSPEREATMLVYFLKSNSRSSKQDSRSRDAVDRLEALIGQMASAGDVNLADHFRGVINRL